jgi:PST family polysaccharide transporter
MNQAVEENLAGVPKEENAPEAAVTPGELRQRTARGALVATVVQGVSLVLRIGSMMVLARLLLKEDFGLTGMVMAFTGVLTVLRDAGLSMVTVQRESITAAQTSTLFWLSAALGSVLAILTALGAPLLVAFYAEPRLFWVTVLMSTTFVINGVSVQHRAIMQRRMRISRLAIVDVGSLMLSIVLAVSMAWKGWGYWSLVAMTVAQPAVGAIGVWLATRWNPGRPRLQAGVGSMMRFGGAVTLNNITMYIAYNADKALLGRFFGAEALGVYGRAYQLINLSTENLNTVMGVVAFPALSRLQGDPGRQKSYFLTGYALLLSLAIPLAGACALFAEDIVLVALGPQWQDASSVFRLLAPTVIVFGLINPLGWLLYATGHARRNMWLALLIGPVVVLGYFAGLQYGPEGVAIGYSAAMVLLVVPVIVWATRGLPITPRDMLRAAAPIVCSAAAASAALLVAADLLAQIENGLLRLVGDSTAFFAAYLVMLLFVMNQKTMFIRVLRETGLWPLKGLAEAR